jgi:hypothetical protein
MTKIAITSVGLARRASPKLAGGESPRITYAKRHAPEAAEEISMRCQEAISP